MPLFPCFDLGRSKIKSIGMLLHGAYGTRRGIRSPGFFHLLYFAEILCYILGMSYCLLGQNKYLSNA